MWLYATGKYHLGIITNDLCYSDTARDVLIKEAMKYNPDYILLLDADQIYPGNTPEILMKHIDSGKLVVGGISPLKKASNPAIDGKPSMWDLDTSRRLVRHREVVLHQGMIKVDAMGLGGIMMNPKVFKTLKFPWFRVMWNEEEKHRFGADFSFYSHCKDAGIDVWCDTDLIFGHVTVRPVPLKEKKSLLTL